MGAVEDIKRGLSIPTLVWPVKQEDSNVGKPNYLRQRQSGRHSSTNPVESGNLVEINFWRR